MSVVLVSQTAGVVTVVINRPDSFNALNAEVLLGLRDAVVAAAQDPTVRAVVVTGAGEKAFCAGADLKELVGVDRQGALDRMRQGQAVMRTVESAGVPVIAAVNGVALGGGFELALAATFTVLSTKASFGLPESGLGLIPGYGGTQRLPRAVGPRVASHLMLTGSRLDADRAHALGLTPVPPVDPEDLLETATEIAVTIGRQGPLATRSILLALERGRDLALDDALALETDLAADAVAGSESDEGVNAFLERRPPRFAPIVHTPPTTQEA